jgi:anti-sigma B factor antagonist
MDIKTTQYKRCVVVKSSGRVDSSNSSELEEAMNGVTESGKFKIVFDMNEINFVSSAGWWVLINTQKTCKRYNRGELVLVNVDKEIRDSLNLVGMGSYFRIFDTVIDAVGNL